MILSFPELGGGATTLISWITRVLSLKITLPLLPSQWSSNFVLESLTKAEVVGTKVPPYLPVLEILTSSIYPLNPWRAHN